MSTLSLSSLIPAVLQIRPTAQEALIKSQNATPKLVSYELSNQENDLYQGYYNNCYGGFFLFDWEITLLIRKAIRHGHTRCYIMSDFGIKQSQWQRLRKLGYLIENGSTWSPEGTYITNISWSNPKLPKIPLTEKEYSEAYFKYV